jgi:hypothetical protein
MINAPNAILNDESWYTRGITRAIFTQRLSADNFPPKGSSKSEGEGGASSAFMYTIARGDARVPKLF